LFQFLLVIFFQGVLLGLSNTAGVLAGVFGTAATGYILQHGKNSSLAFIAAGKTNSKVYYTILEENQQKKN
jgi:ACS family sodium-dependent inorganic phosphate cotransporter